MFIYWGWESAVNLNEETEGSATAPGLAAVLSTVILLVTYVLTTDRGGGATRASTASPSSRTTPGIFGALAGDVLGSPLDKLVVLAVIMSALSSTQTTILPASRTTLSMARQGAFPEAFGRVHPRFLTPHVSTIAIGLIASVWFGVLFPLSENFVYDSLTSLAFMIAFYYALTGFACAIYYRRELTKSVKNFFFIGVGPVVGGLILGYLFFKAIDEYRDPAASYSGSEVFGAGGAGGARHRVAAARGGADDPVAAGRARRVLRAQAGRSWIPTWRPAASWAWPRSRRRRSDGRDRAGLRRFARSQVGARRARWTWRASTATSW